MIFELILLILTGLVLWTIQINTGTKWRKRPPGPIQFPVIGNLPQMIRRVRQSKGKAPFLAFGKFSKEYGPVVTLQMGLSLNVLIEDPDLLKEVFNSEAWSDRNFDLLFGLRSFDHPHGLLFSRGEEWKEMRRFTLRTLRDFGFGKHKDQESVLQEELAELMSRLDARIDKNKSGNRGFIINMEQFFTVSVLNILWSLMAGDRFSHDDDRLKNMNELTSKAIRFVTPGSNMLQAFSCTFVRFLLVNFTTKGKFLTKYLGQMHQFFRNILEERRSLGFYKDDQRDFIDVFLKEIDNHKADGDDPNKNFYNDNQFLVVVLDLFQAGSETTSNTLEFAFLYMVLNPTIQTKVQEEIDQVVGRSRFPSYATDRVNMPFTEATLHEVQRMASVVPIDNRNTTQDTTLGGYFIAKGTPAILNIHSVHYNEKLWGDPTVFRPERFLDSQSNLVNTNKLIPFGGGKRLCLGESMARATLFTYFTSFLQKYSFAQVPNEPKPVAEPRPGFTLSPYPYDVVISYRR